MIDYLTYGGIYRDTYLEVKHPSYIRDVFVKAGMDRGLTLEIDWQDPQPGQKARVQIAGLDETLDLQPSYRFENLPVELWDTDHPNLYPLTGAAAGGMARSWIPSAPGWAFARWRRTRVASGSTAGPSASGGSTGIRPTPMWATPCRPGPRSGMPIS
ncbi:MAG: hypothetical protein ACLU9S_08050 [Oscillospiraceae bacterium]